jgi:DNA polymerase-3 subunit gamma/tau
MVLTSGDAIGAERQEIGDRADASLHAFETDAVSGDEPAAVAEVSVAMAPTDLQSSSLHYAETLQRAATEALSRSKNQDTAADALADAEWTVAGDEVRVQTELSKTMLPMVINVEAEKIVKAALRDAGAGGLKLVLLPGVKTAAVKKPRAVKSGSAQAKAMEHPIVQRAQSLFNAEVRTVIDLRDAD